MADSNTSFALNQFETASVAYLFADNSPAPTPPSIVPVWTDVDPDGTISITPAADGMSAVVTAQKVTAANVAVITVTATLASGVAITGTAEVTITAESGDPTQLSISFSAPSPKA